MLIISKVKRKSLAKELGLEVGDGITVYGYKKQKIKTNGQLLHAYKLTLSHPTTGKEMSFNAPLPPVL